MTLKIRLMWSAIIRAVTFLIVLLSHNVAKQLMVFSTQSGLTFFCYLLLFHLIDILKAPNLKA